MDQDMKLARAYLEMMLANGAVCGDVLAGDVINMLCGKDR